MPSLRGSAPAARALSLQAWNARPDGAMSGCGRPERRRVRPLGRHASRGTPRRANPATHWSTTTVHGTVWASIPSLKAERPSRRRKSPERRHPVVASQSPLQPPISMSEGWSQRPPLTMKDPLNHDISRSQPRYQNRLHPARKCVSGKVPTDAHDGPHASYRCG